jgi:hypothetical protein
MPLGCAGSRNERVAIDETGVRLCKQAINFLTSHFSARASHAQRSSREPHARRRARPKSTPESVVVGVGSAGKWQIATEAGGTFWLLPSSPVFKIERLKLTILGSGI